MPIPDYQTLMLPVLHMHADGEEHSLREAVEALAAHFRLTPGERKNLLPSGKQPTFDNRVSWARTYLKKAGLLESPRRGFTRITPRGRQVLAADPSEINVKLLERFEEFKAFRSKKSDALATPDPPPGAADTPEEALEAAHQSIRDGLAEELLATLKQCSPAFFERLVVDVLVGMGYGGSRREAGRAVGGSGDDGIDGIINEDRLGLDTIYLQAKRWEGTVSRPEIQKFAGALQGNRARKGIFITTSGFSREAREYVSRIDSKIVLIDGARLTELMIDHNVGVTVEAVYEVKRVDSDYFSEE